MRTVNLTGNVKRRWQFAKHFFQETETTNFWLILGTPILLTRMNPHPRLGIGDAEITDKFFSKSGVTIFLNSLSDFSHHVDIKIHVVIRQ